MMRFLQLGQLLVEPLVLLHVSHKYIIGKQKLINLTVSCTGNLRNTQFFVFGSTVVLEKFIHAAERNARDSLVSVSSMIVKRSKYALIIIKIKGTKKKLTGSSCKQTISLK